MAMQSQDGGRGLMGFLRGHAGFVPNPISRRSEKLSSRIRDAEVAVAVCPYCAVGCSQNVYHKDGQTGHDSSRVRVPEHVHLLFLPPHSPELQPAEHLWPLTNTGLVNQHFASIDELEDAQAERCVALRAHRELIRSATLFHC